MAEKPTPGPYYYQRGSIQVWDFIRDQGLNFHLGNAVKYICRAGYKGSREEDLEKAIVYLQNELTHARRQDLSRQPLDSSVLTGTGVPGGLSDIEFKPAPSPFSSKELDYGGVQGVFGGGGTAIFN